ncbi:hypothetical protein FVEN_g12187 [Fusarium venenatum]|uniref:Uncharacterized protein n=1 Tax=Fusarium venenatum TaxID=56646 RepID=A0A2L2TTC8_9HYPO|nr:uncharacterized protein FVRRES_09738 [Fusarium venenatum]KAG8349645.1 hypothetical protein FVEN_g12187 [Fusarium venenatum]KAH6966390.1 hypothetical protein EDB82DRAFT_579978 [Fusarium venenatum]CEI69661.1 unnamed protein product [Fusarium venenatum]
MSSNTSPVPPGPPNEVSTAETHEGAPRDSSRFHHHTPRQSHFPAFAQLPYPYTYGPGSPYAPQYNPYHQPQLGYHHFHQQQARQNVTIDDGITAEYSPESQRPPEESKPIHLRSRPCRGKNDDDTSLRPDLGVSFENVEEDKAVAEDRPPNKAIPKESLTRGEKMRLLDLLKQYEDVQRSGGVFRSATKTYQQFYQAIFRRSWDTSSKSCSPVTLRSARSSDACLEIGHYEKDAPSSRSDDECRGSKVLKQTIPIFLTLDLRAGEIDWMYHDKDGNHFKARDVTLHHGLSIEQAKKNVLDYQDQKEMKRICEHNIDQIVHAARRRIVKWARAGSAAQLGVDDEDRAALELLELPSERFLARFEEVRVLRDYLVQRPELSYEN